MPRRIVFGLQLPRVRILPIADVTDHRGPVGVFFVDFAIRAAKLPEIIEDDIGLEIEAWS